MAAYRHSAVEKSREMRLRRWARKVKHELYKDRARIPGAFNRGGYQLADETGAIVVGVDFGTDLDAVEAFLVAKIEEFRAR